MHVSEFLLSLLNGGLDNLAAYLAALITVLGTALWLVSRKQQ